MHAYNHDTVIAAQHRLEEAVLTAIQCRHYARESDPHADASMDLADDEVALAARDLTAAIGGMSVGDRPIGWDANSFGPFSTVPAATQ